MRAESNVYCFYCSGTLGSTRHLAGCLNMRGFTVSVGDESREGHVPMGWVESWDGNQVRVFFVEDGQTRFIKSDPRRVFPIELTDSMMTPLMAPLERFTNGMKEM